MCWSIVDYHEQRQESLKTYLLLPQHSLGKYLSRLHITLSRIKLIVLYHQDSTYFKNILQEWVGFYTPLTYHFIGLCWIFYSLMFVMCSVEEENNHFLFQTYHFIRHLETNITIQHIWRGYWWWWWWPRVCWRMPVHWCWPGEPPVPGDSHRILRIQIFLPSTH